MIKSVLQILPAVIFFLLNLNAQNASQDIVTGKTFSIDSKILNEHRVIHVGLPANYEQSKEKYPVLLVLDGEGNFNFSNGLINFLGQTGRFPQMIVIGIPNINRNRDFTPTMEEGRAAGGGAEKFIGFIEKEVFPFFESNYRISPYRILFGHSLGGMFAVHCLINHNDLFDGYIAASPYLQYNNHTILKDVESKMGNIGEHKLLFIALGNEPAYTEGITELINLLDDTPNDLPVKYVQLENEDHNSIRLRALYQGLEFIFNDWQINTDEIAGGCKSIKEKYQKLSRTFGYEIFPGEAVLNIIGYGYLNNQDFEEAINTFKWNVELYPESSNVYDSLGEAFEKSKQYEQASENYKVAAEIGKKTNSPNLQIYETNYSRVQHLLSK